MDARYSLEVTGYSALLMHGDDIGFADRLQEWRKDSRNKSVSKPGDDRSPAWTWVGGLYHDGKHVALPADNLAVALRMAGTKMILRGAKTLKEEAVSGLYIEELYLPIEVNGKTIPVAQIVNLEADEVNDFNEHLALVEKLKFKLHMKRAKVGTSKHIRVRAMFEPWACRCTIVVTSEAIKPPVLAEMCRLAGKVGVGSWRPGGKTPGRYGMFTTVVTPLK